MAAGLVAPMPGRAEGCRWGNQGVVLTLLISRSIKLSAAAVGPVGLWATLLCCPQIHRLVRARWIAACAACSARGKNLLDWRGRHGADLNGQVSDRRRAPHRAEHACRGSIPIIADHVHVRCCPRRRRLPGCFCAHAAKLRFSSAATAIAARFTARKAVHKRRGATLSARLAGGTRPAAAVG